MNYNIKNNKKCWKYLDVNDMHGSEMSLYLPKNEFLMNKFENPFWIIHRESNYGSI